MSNEDATSSEPTTRTPSNETNRATATTTMTADANNIPTQPNLQLLSSLFSELSAFNGRIAALLASHGGGNSNLLTSFTRVDNNTNNTNHDRIEPTANRHRTNGKHGGGQAQQTVEGGGVQTAATSSSTHAGSIKDTNSSSSATLHVAPAAASASVASVSHRPTKKRVGVRSTPSALVLFDHSIRPTIVAQHPSLNQVDVNRLIIQAWKDLSMKDRQLFERDAQLAKMEAEEEKREEEERKRRKIIGRSTNTNTSNETTINQATRMMDVASSSSHSLPSAVSHPVEHSPPRILSHRRTSPPPSAAAVNGPTQPTHVNNHTESNRIVTNVSRADAMASLINASQSSAALSSSRPKPLDVAPAVDDTPAIHVLDPSSDSDLPPNRSPIDRRQVDRRDSATAIDDEPPYGPDGSPRMRPNIIRPYMQPTIMQTHAHAFQTPTHNTAIYMQQQPTQFLPIYPPPPSVGYALPPMHLRMASIYSNYVDAHSPTSAGVDVGGYFGRAASPPPPHPSSVAIMQPHRLASIDTLYDHEVTGLTRANSQGEPQNMQATVEQTQNSQENKQT